MTEALTGDKTKGEKVLRMPYAGSKAMLKIGRRWIGSKYKAELYEARAKRPGSNILHGKVWMNQEGV
jgi:hypothetical protein